MQIKDLSERLKEKEEDRRRFQPVTREQINKEARTIDISFSSELPVIRWYGIEILDHSSKAMRMDRAVAGIALLFNHNRSMHLGIMENCRCNDDEKKGRGTARFGRSALAEGEWRDGEGGILKDVSVGDEAYT